MRRITVEMVALVLCLLSAASGVALADVAAPGQPVLTVHYDCDGAIDPVFKDPLIIPDGKQRRVTVTGHGTVYFSITTQMHKPGETPAMKTMHFVLGTYDGQQGQVRIQGRKGKSDREAALVELDRGWLWSSSSKPPQWSGGAGTSTAARVDQHAEPGPTPLNTTPSVSWSIYTLLRTRYTWAGAIGSEYIYRFESVSGPNETVSLYNLDRDHTAFHSYSLAASPKKHDLSQGTFSRSTKRGDAKPGQPTDQSATDKAFVRYVRCRVDQIKSQPEKPECAAHHESAKRGACE